MFSFFVFILVVLIIVYLYFRVEIQLKDFSKLKTKIINESGNFDYELDRPTFFKFTTSTSNANMTLKIKENCKMEGYTFIVANDTSNRDIQVILSGFTRTRRGVSYTNFIVKPGSVREFIFETDERIYQISESIPSYP